MKVSRHDLGNLTVAQVVSLGSSLAVTLVTAAFLGANGRGQLAFVVGLANLTGALSFASLQVGAVDAHKRGDGSAVRRSLWLGVWAGSLTLLLGGTLSAFAYLSPFAFASGGELLFGAIGAALVTTNLVVLRMVQGLGHARGFRVAWTMQAAVYAFAGIPAAWIFGSPFPVLICWFVGLIWSTIYSLRYLPPPLSQGLVVPTRSLLVTSLSAHLGASGIQLLYRLDIVVLAFFVSRSDLGIYSIAVPLASLTWIVSEALSLSAFSTFDPQDTRQQQRSHLLKFIRVNLALGSLGSAAILVVAYLAIPPLLTGYSDAVLLIAILLPGVVIQGAARILFAHIMSVGARREGVVVGVASLALSALYVPFCAEWGIRGAAVASTFIYVLQALVVVICTVAVLDRPAPPTPS
jgi:O-antigen/teichoic acid export membrane protein